MSEELGAVRVTPHVLATIAQLTAQAVPGVAELSRPSRRSLQRVLSRQYGNDGVAVEVREGSVYVDIWLALDPEANMPEVGRKVQVEVARSISELVGMDVREVNVYIQEIKLA
jgi:uncharacterized alkaline shock family protein YloU